MNKYLEKIAIFGFSKAEKIQKASSDFGIATYNTYADSFNKRIKGINDSYRNKEGKHDFSDNPHYVAHVVKSMHGDKELFEKYRKLHKDHSAKLNALGAGGVATNPDKDMHDFIDHIGKGYLM